MRHKLYSTHACRWNQLHLNTRTMASDVKVEELLVELNDLQWDAITINETRREEKEELLQLEGGHRWLGSGGGG